MRSAAPPNKGMKQTSVERNGRSQLIPGVRRTWEGSHETVTRVRPLLVVGAGACALVAIVTTSLNPDAYFYYQHKPRPPWEFPTTLVLFVVGATIAETCLAYAVFAKRRVGALWKSASLAFLVLVPWSMLFSGWVVHAPGFWLLHLLWVWLLMAALALTAVLSGTVSGYRAYRARSGVIERAVEQ
jgi:hypothetical protein